jgi:hypothetical protein
MATIFGPSGFEDQDGPYQYRCSVRDYGQGIYTLSLSDQAGSTSCSALELPHALAGWLKQNPELVVVSVAVIDSLPGGRLLVVTRSK